MKRKVEITLGLEIEAFEKGLKSRFLQTISVISGAPIDEIEITDVRSGCVKVTIEIDEEAFKKLMHALEPSAANLEPLAADQISALGILWNELKFQFLADKGLKAADARPESASQRPGRIFLVHGWRGGDETFGDLPQFIEDGTGCKCTKFNYPSGFFERSSSIAFLARAFDNWVRNELDDGGEGFGLIAHSMGGVIVRDFLGSQLLRASPLSERVKHVSFVASPQGGAWLAKIAKLLPSSATQQVADLAPNSEYLGAVSSSWNAWYPRQKHLVGQIRSFYAVADEYVDYVSAIGSDPEAVPILDANHSSIVKPKNNTDEIVRTIVRLVKSSGLSPSVGGFDRDQQLRFRDRQSGP